MAPTAFAHMEVKRISTPDIPEPSEAPEGRGYSVITPIRHVSYSADEINRVDNWERTLLHLIQKRFGYLNIPASFHKDSLMLRFLAGILTTYMLLLAIIPWIACFTTATVLGAE